MAAIGGHGCKSRKLRALVSTMNVKKREDTGSSLKLLASKPIPSDAPPKLP